MVERGYLMVEKTVSIGQISDHRSCIFPEKQINRIRKRDKQGETKEKTKVRKLLAACHI